MKKEKYIPLFTFSWSAEGQIAPSPFRVNCPTIMEALLWFHLERQLRDRLSSENYSIDTVTTDQTPPQSWQGGELPRRANLNWCVLTPKMAKAFSAEINEARQRGLHFKVE